MTLSEDYQIQILNECQNFFLVFLADERLDFLKGDVSLFLVKGFRVEFPADEPVCDVYVVLKVINCGISLEEVAYADVEIGHGSFI